MFKTTRQKLEDVLRSAVAYTNSHLDSPPWLADAEALLKEIDRKEEESKKPCEPGCYCMGCN